MEMRYETTLYFHRQLQRCARVFLEHLPDDVDALMSTGSSGCALASAMVVLSEKPLDHLYVRKDAEEGSKHNCGSAGHYSHTLLYAIVDDLVDSRQTMENLAEYVHKTGLHVKCALVGKIMNQTWRFTNTHWTDKDTKIEGIKVLNMKKYLEEV